MIIQHQVIVSRVLCFDSIVIGRRPSCNSNFNYCNIVYTCMYVRTCIATKDCLMTDVTVVVSLSLSLSLSLSPPPPSPLPPPSLSLSLSFSFFLSLSYVYVHVCPCPIPLLYVHTQELQGRQSGECLAIKRFLSPSFSSQDWTALPKSFLT